MRNEERGGSVHFILLAEQKGLPLNLKLVKIAAECLNCCSRYYIGEIWHSRSGARACDVRNFNVI